MRVTCPSCAQACLVPQEHLGKVIRCPGCKQTFGVRSPVPAVCSLEVGSCTSPGRLRERNEDSYFVQQMTWGGQAVLRQVVLGLVADGMGGHFAGDRASALAVSAFSGALAPFLAGLVGGQEKDDDPEPMLDALDRALWEANRVIARAAAEEPGCAGMGSTAVAALVVGPLALICHVGDCRAYLYSAGDLRQLTQDQTLVARMIELGQLTPREAQRHPAASHVTQALGKQEYLEPSRQRVTLRPGDRLVLACDGLHAHLDERDLARIMAQPEDAAGLARVLVDRANKAGGSDNCTVIVIAAR